MFSDAIQLSRSSFALMHYYFLFASFGSKGFFDFSIIDQSTVDDENNAEIRCHHFQESHVIVEHNMTFCRLQFSIINQSRIELS